MKEEKFKKIVIGATVTAVLLVVILVVFWVYQLISISVKEKRIASLEKQIQDCLEIIDNDKALIEEKYMSELWLEWAARQLGMIKEGDK